MQIYTTVMHACISQKRDWKDFLIKINTILIWTLILKTNGIGQSSIHQIYK